jgi:twitching motility two-component system response regulator PilH
MEKKILIVEDEDDVIEFVSTVLRENGFSTVIARNGEEALEIIKEDRPDLVIMDILMPKQSGIRMYRKLKTTEALKQIPVVIYSGIARRTYLRTQAAREEIEGETVPEPEAYVEKPAKPEYLADIVKKVLG